MEWTRSDTLALASNSCTHCHGNGLRYSGRGEVLPCDCVLRGIFRACYDRFRQSVEKEKHVSHSRLEAIPGRENKQSWGRKEEEYIADFCLVTRRSLSTEEYRIFNYHFLLGADWKLCARKLQIDKGLFFHMLYRIEAKLGRVYRELKPYALFPVYEYFHGAWTNPGPITLKKVVPMRGRLEFPRVGGQRKVA